MSKIARKHLPKMIITLLLAGMITMSVFLGGKLEQKKAIDNQKQIVYAQEKADQEVNKLYKKQIVLDETLQEAGKMIVSEGKITSTHTFSSHDNYTMDKDNSNFLKVLHRKLYKRDIVYKVDYKYNVNYDLNSITTRLEGDKLYISIHEGLLKVEGLETDNTYIDESLGWLVKDFSHNEVQAMQKQAKVQTYNYLTNSESIRVKSIENLKRNIEKLCERLNIENYEIITYFNDTLEYENEYLEVDNNIHYSNDLDLKANN
ncbi:MAG: hypothetical protein KHZ90_08165 [Veillonella parvula]|uniref:DUF4230 domain-containing protein n=1 Tax=Veillonella parvula TaxID=29466 RepID=A0A942WVK2_VEIPA|nr:hypothetical protein [Veillonella parvula]MBS4893734.1 hypothetical protein [Veillonella parvula]